MKSKVVVVALVFAAAMLTAFIGQAGTSTPYRKGQEVTVIVPSTVCEKVETKRKKNAGEAFVVAVSIDADGHLVLGGDAMWRSKSLPLVTTGEVTSVKAKKKTGETKLVVTAAEQNFTFRIPTDAPWQEPLAEVLIDGHSTIMEPSPALAETLTTMIDAYCENAFTAPLDALNERIRRRVAELSLAVGSLGPPSTSTLDGAVYIDARLGAGPGFFNSSTTTTTQRAVGTINDRILPAAKTWSKVFYGDVPFDGIRFTAISTSQDFAEYPPLTTTEELDFYVGYDDAEAFAGGDLTAPQLVKRAVVFIDGKRQAGF